MRKQRSENQPRAGLYGVGALRQVPDRRNDAGRSMPCWPIARRRPSGEKARLQIMAHLHRLPSVPMQALSLCVRSRKQAEHLGQGGW